MRVRVGKPLKYDDLRQGRREIPAGKYSVTPLEVGNPSGGTQTVAYKLKSRRSKDVYRLEARTFKAWKKADKVVEI